MLNNIFAGCAVALFATVGAASAATLTISSVEGSWSNPVVTGPKRGALTGVGTDTVSWGAPVRGHVRSSYSFDGDGVSTDTAGSFLIGAYTHHNGKIWTRSQQLRDADLTVSVQGDLDGSSFSFGNTFRFSHWETLNPLRPCPEGSGSDCGDLVGITSLLSEPFTIVQGSTIFTLIIDGFVESLGGPVVDALLTPEGAERQLFLQARLQVGTVPDETPAPVPLPAAALLLFSALGSLALMRRNQG